MATLKSTQDNGTFISNIIDQGSNENDWTSYQPSFKGLGPPFVIDPDTTNTTLVTIGGSLPVEGDPVLAKDGTETNVVSGNLGAVVSSIVDIPFDAVVYSGNSIDFSNENGSPVGMAFNDDGTKVFMITDGVDDIYQYSLSSAYDVSTARFDNVEFFVGNQISNPYDMSFNDVGTIMHVLSNSTDQMFQYNLAEPFNILTATYNGVTFGLANEGNWPWGHTFSTDGTKLFTVDNTQDAIFQYTLGTPWDLGARSGTIQPTSLDISPQESNPQGIHLSNDGTTMIAVGSALGVVGIHGYTLSTPYDLETATFNSSFDPSAQTTTALGVWVTDDGTKMFVLESQYIYTYTLTTANDVSTATYDGDITRQFITGIGSQPQDLEFSADGTKLYIYYTFGTTLRQISLATPFVVTSGDFGIDAQIELISLNNQDTAPLDFDFNNDGSKLYMLGAGSDQVFSYTLSTPYNISTAVYDNASFSVTAQASSPIGIDFSNDGTRMYILDTNMLAIYEYTLTTAFDITTAVYDNTVQDVTYDGISLSIASQDNTPGDIAFDSAGTSLYYLGRGTDSVYKYTLTTPFDISTATYDNLLIDVSNEDTQPRGITVADNNSKLFVVGESADAGNEYLLTKIRYETDITSLGLASVPTVVCKDDLPRMFSSYELDPNECLSQNIDLSYVSSTTTEFIGGDPSVISGLLASGSSIIPYEGTPPAPISRASVETSYSFCPDWVVDGITMSPDGTTLYVVGQRSKRIFQYSLSTPFDISTAVYQHINETHAFVNSQDQTPRGITFNNDGSKLYMIGSSTGQVYQYSLVIPYDIATLSYDNVSFAAAIGRTVGFSNDGTKLFTGNLNSVINQYTLSTPFDLSTATTVGVVSFNSVPSSIATADEVALTNERAALASNTTLCHEFNNDGTKVYVGAEAPTYEANTTIVPPFTTSDDLFGQDVAVDGQRVIVGTRNGESGGFVLGSVYIYEFDGTSYNQIQIIEGPVPSRHGDGLSANNDRLIVGNPTAASGGINPGVVYVYDWNGTAYSLTTSFTASDATDGYLFGDSVSLKGNRLAVGAPSSGFTNDTRPGKVYVYEWNGSSYDLLTSIEGTNIQDRFGVAVAIDGNRLVVGGVPINGVDSIVYVYDWNGTSFDQVNTIPKPNYFSLAAFGGSLALDGTRLLIGDPLSNAYGNPANGLVIVYEQDGTTYRQVRSFAPDDQYNEFGTGVAVQGTTVVVGAPVNDDVALNVGKVYVYDIPLGITGEWDFEPNAPVVDQYRLETAFDITTVVYEKTLSLATVDSETVKSINFSNDGLNLYVLGDRFTQTGDIYQYTLATPFEVDTGTYNGSKIAVVTLEEVRRVLFNDTGSVAYALSTYDPQIREYSLSTPYDVSTMNWTGESIDLDNVGITYSVPYPTDMKFNNNGTKFYFLDSFGSPLHQFTLSIPYDVKTLTYDFVDYTFSEVSGPYNFIFNNDGSKLIVVDQNSSTLRQYNLSTPFDISTTTYGNVTFNTNVDGNSAVDIAFNSDETKMYTLVFNFNSGIKRVHQFTLLTPFNISTATYDNVFYDIEKYLPDEPLNGSFYQFFYFLFNNDKSKFYVGAVYNYTTFIGQFTLPNSVDGELPLIENPEVSLTSAPVPVFTDPSIKGFEYNDTSFSVSAQDGTPVGVTFSTDGLKMFMIGASSDTVYQYTLTTAFEVSTASYASISFSLTGQTSTVEGFSLGADGTKMYVAEYNGFLYQYTLATAFDLSVVTYDNISLDVSAQEPELATMTFNSDGTKMYVAGYRLARINQYTLLTPFDISTATYDNIFLPTYLQDPEIQSVTFNSAGTKLFFAGGFTDTVYQYLLSTPFDLSTASYDFKKLNIGDVEFNPTGIAFSSDDLKLFVTGTGSDSINEFTLDPDALSLTFSALPYSPGKVAVPDRSVEHTTVAEDKWVDNYVQRSFTIIEEDGRAVQYKFVMNTDTEVIEARYDLTKIAPGIRDV